VVLAVLAVAALALNPSAEKHRSTIKASVSDRSPIAGALGLGALTAFASNYHSYLLYSTTTVNDKVVSVGAFGMVFARE
jgi:hypothetical protein